MILLVPPVFLLSLGDISLVLNILSIVSILHAAPQGAVRSGFGPFLVDIRRSHWNRRSRSVWVSQVPVVNVVGHFLG